VRHCAGWVLNIRKRRPSKRTWTRCSDGASAPSQLRMNPIRTRATRARRDTAWCSGAGACSETHACTRTW
jgi:hypothetical protein